VVQWLESLVRISGRFLVIHITIHLDNHNVAILDDDEVWFDA
jgi:hypothetical protein